MRLFSSMAISDTSLHSRKAQMQIAPKTVIRKDTAPNVTINKRETLKAKGHQFGEWKVTKKSRLSD